MGLFGRTRVKTWRNVERNVMLTTGLKVEKIAK